MWFQFQISNVGKRYNNTVIILPYSNTRNSTHSRFEVLSSKFQGSKQVRESSKFQVQVPVSRVEGDVSTMLPDSWLNIKLL